MTQGEEASEEKAPRERDRVRGVHEATCGHHVRDARERHEHVVAREVGLQSPGERERLSKGQVRVVVVGENAHVAEVLREVMAAENGEPRDEGEVGKDEEGEEHALGVRARVQTRRGDEVGGRRRPAPHLPGDRARVVHSRAHGPSFGIRKK